MMLWGLINQYINGAQNPVPDHLLRWKPGSGPNNPNRKFDSPMVKQLTPQEELEMGVDEILKKHARAAGLLKGY